jgi:hypothetical protein
MGQVRQECRKCSRGATPGGASTLRFLSTHHVEACSALGGGLDEPLIQRRVHKSAERHHRGEDVLVDVLHRRLFARLCGIDEELLGWALVLRRLAGSGIRSWDELEDEDADLRPRF